MYVYVTRPPRVRTGGRVKKSKVWLINKDAVSNGACHHGQCVCVRSESNAIRYTNR